MLNIDEPSSIVRYLTQGEVADIRGEIARIQESDWKHHLDDRFFHRRKNCYACGKLTDNPKYCSRECNPFKNLVKTLPEGKTVYLRNQGYQECYLDNFATTRKIIYEIADGRRLGKCYWHRFTKGAGVDLHEDSYICDHEPVDYRYHIYIDIPPNMDIIYDGEPKPIEPIQNSIVNFNLLRKHYYKNNDDQPFIVMVFDVLKYA
jgi:hypothetical protein